MTIPQDRFSISYDKQGNYGHQFIIILCLSLAHCFALLDAMVIARSTFLLCDSVSNITNTN